MKNQSTRIPYPNFVGVCAQGDGPGRRREGEDAAILKLVCV
jgi:hypothetical protein